MKNQRIKETQFLYYCLKCEIKIVPGKSFTIQWYCLFYDIDFSFTWSGNVRGTIKERSDLWQCTDIMIYQNLLCRSSSQPYPESPFWLDWFVTYNQFTLYFPSDKIESTPVNGIFYKQYRVISLASMVKEWWFEQNQLKQRTEDLRSLDSQKTSWQVASLPLSFSLTPRIGQLVSLNYPFVWTYHLSVTF